VDTISRKRHQVLIGIIIDERKRAGLRQVELAKKLKKTQTWVSRLEQGGRRLDVVEFMRLAEVIGFDPVATIRQLSAIAH